MKDRLLKYLSGILFVLIFAACGDNSGKNASTTLTSPASAGDSSALSTAELTYYKQVVENFIDSNFSSGRLNGSILVAKNGEIVFEEYWGYRDPRVKKDSIDASTAFHLASVSKPITATAILKLWEDGKLHIDDTVGRYLPNFPCKGVTIRMLLNHRSGIPNYVHYMERLGWDRRQHMTNEDVLQFLIERRDDIQIGAPDRGFSYSNTNYALLALIVERVSGQFFGDYLRLNFFEPLRMDDSYVFTRADSAHSLPSFFYSGRQYAFDYLDLVYGDKNIYSTVRDLLKWDQALNSGQLLKKETQELAYTPYSFEKPGINNYGLGWRMQLLPNGKKFIYHNGWWHGNRTAFYRLIPENATIIALCNNDYTRVYSSKLLADAFGNYFREVDEPPVITEKKSSPTASGNSLEPRAEEGSPAN